MKVNIKSVNTVKVPDWLLSSSKGNSHHLGISAQSMIWTFKDIFCVMISSCSLLQKNFVPVFQMRWRRETFLITTVAAQSFFIQDKIAE